MPGRTPESISVLAISFDPFVREYLGAEFGLFGDSIVFCEDAVGAEAVLNSRLVDAVLAVETPLPGARSRIAFLEFNQEYHPGDRANLDGVLTTKVEDLQKAFDMTHHMVNIVRQQSVIH